MAASAVQNPSVRSESKSAKKKAKSETPAASAPEPVADVTTSNGPESNNGDGSYESPYIKELYKSIRNVNKKIANASKVDGILAENPNKSLDELVAARKINTDQKAQILKKPSLQASLAQLEEQIAQYKKFDQEYKTKSQAEKAEFEKTFTQKAEKDLKDALASAKAEAVAEASKEQYSNMLLLSQFLRLAAAKRAEEPDSEVDANQALEGVLLQVYSGDNTAVETMIKLIKGSLDSTYSTSGIKLQTTFAQVKTAAVEAAPPTIPAEISDEETYDSPAVETSKYQVQSDPTIVNAGLTELDDVATAALSNGHGDASAEAAAVGIPQNSGIDEGASNAAAESHWDPSNDLSTSQEWVDVKLPRDTAETGTGITATPAAAVASQSWADDQPDSPTTADAVASGNDGFHEVQRSRGGRGGRGGEGGYTRGRGGRGGRGRGSYRGNDGGYRGRGPPRDGGAPRQRRTEES